jgi:DNA-directed RNA polymerase specialized sigma54-like protein
VDLKNDRLQIQSQRLSPSMLRSLDILQLPMEELHRLVAAEIQHNPLLDITDTVPYALPSAKMKKALLKRARATCKMAKKRSKFFRKY